MEDTRNNDEGLGRWTIALREIEKAGVFSDAVDDDGDRIVGLWSSFAELARTKAPGDTAELSALLGQVASYSLRPDDWACPYEPMLNMVEGRTAVPDDLTPEELEMLRAVALKLPDPLLRARTCDVIALRSVGADRMRWYEAELDALADARSPGRVRYRADDAWDRGLLVARHYGTAFDPRLRVLAGILLDHVLNADRTEHPGRVADLLAKHKLSREDANAIANRMRDHAIETDADIARAYHDRASFWYQIADRREDAVSEVLAIVQSLVDEAATHESTTDLSASARAAHLYEQALKTLRTIPRRQREARGVGGLTEDLAKRIRAAGAASLGSMRAFRSEAADLTALRDLSVAAVSNKEPLDALREFVGLAPFASVERDRTGAKELLEKHPLQSLFSNVHYAHDGRVVHRSAGRGGEPIYGEDPAVWRQMIQTYEFRVAIEVQGQIAPAWLALHNEHRLTSADFVEIMRGSSIVPSGREQLFAQAFYYGFDGDFTTAAQLLAPQMEHIVRLHLRNAGELTSTLDARGIENEVGLSALMSRAAVVEIFGEDIAYEVRALFCGPIGPNLRNTFAHGLVDDGWISSVNAIYCWWFMLRLTFVPFWNRLHDAKVADSHEPTEREEPDVEAADSETE